MSAQRLLIIGLDGATFSILGPYMEQGRLPNLKRLIDTGTAGTLRSTLPPMTCPAWPTFATGQGCGKHGLFTFIMYDVATGRAEFVNNRACRCKKLWHYAAEQGLRPACISVPITYPADRFDGLMVSGFPAIGLDQHSFHPPEKMEDFKAYVGDWEMSSGMVSPQRTLAEKVAYFARKMNEEVESRVRALQFAVTTVDPHLAVVVLKTSDNMQHALYGLAAPREPGAPPHDELRRRVADIYAKLDEGVGRFLETFGDDANVIVMSDHGFTRQRGKLLCDELLSRDGLVVQSFRQRVNELTDAALRRLRSRLKLHRLKPDAAPLAARSEKRRKYVEGQSADLTRSKAFCAAPTCMGIWLNLRGRNLHGIVDPVDEADRLCELIAERLLQVQDPATGQAMFKAVHRKEDVYSGPCLDRIPDLLVEANPGYGLSPGFLAWKRGRPPATSLSWPDGDHAPEGIVVLNGPAFTKGQRIEADIWDIAPTALAVLGLPVPPEMDGRVLSEAFAEGPAVHRPSPGQAVVADTTAAEASPYSPEAEALITKRLEDLGYL